MLVKESWMRVACPLLARSWKRFAFRMAVVAGVWSYSAPASWAQDTATAAGKELGVFQEAKGPAWGIRSLMLDANEGCAVGDIDGDGRLDVVAGRHWYRSPDWVPRPIRTIEDWNGYVQSNGDFLLDVNQDGRLDVIAGSFIPSQVHWYQNPGEEALRLGQTWPKHLLVDTGKSENEGQLMEDIDGNGTPDWIVNSWNAKNPVMVYRLMPSDEPGEGGAKYRLIASEIAPSGNSHGMGVGDLNGDGRKDLLTGTGWYEQPAEGAWEKGWKHHPDWQIQASVPMLVHDLDRDGKADILVGEGHDYGLYWWRQTGKNAEGKIAFDRILVDRSYSQPHALALADLDGDGREELITGKRYFAHNGGDPGGKDMPLLVFYQYRPESGDFLRTTVEQGHVGIGLQIATGDLDGDQKIDIAVAGKSGTHVLLNPAP